MHRSSGILLVTGAALTAFAGGCATYTPPAPISLDLSSRADTRSEDGLRVAAALPSPEQERRVFGTSLVARGIQPIWLEIDNREDEEYVLLLIAVDPNYFAPSEAAWKTRRLGERGLAARMAYYLERHIPVRVAPHSTATGFVYTNFDPGAKAFSVELLGTRRFRSFDFAFEVPGFEADYMSAPPDTGEGAPPDLDLGGLRAWLEALPCCVLGGDRKTPGDPMNLVVVGEPDDVLATFVRRGWDLTETVRAGTALRTAASSLFGSRYRTSPVSPLYVFDRPQDVALQKSRATVDERNHLRLWRAPVRFQGTPVWVGQISRDIGVKLSSRTFVTHKIDPVVDEARFYVIQDLAVSGAMIRAGYAAGVGRATPDEPRFNYTRDPYFTDGLRVVIFLAGAGIGWDAIEWLDWEQPPSRVQ